MGRLSRMKEQNESLAEYHNSVVRGIDHICDYVEGIMRKHSPRIAGRVDLSMGDTPEDSRSRVAEAVDRNLWCSYCSTRWPCRTIDDLRPLRHALRSGSDMPKRAKALEESVRGINRPRLDGLEICL